MVEQQPQPTTDHEWTVHSLNIHGLFFERSCQRQIAGARGWRVIDTNYPVHAPLADAGGRTVESELDIWAERRLGAGGNDIVQLLIECKKNNPDFIDWVFFPRPSVLESERFFWSYIENIPKQDSYGGWNTRLVINRSYTELPFSREARETRGDYISAKSGNKTKTANNSIQDAAHQVAVAMSSIRENLMERSMSLGHKRTLLSEEPQPPLIFRRLLLFPVIVTTANLFMCEFNDAAVDTRTGTIAWNEVKLHQTPYLLYEYGIPSHLQITGTPEFHSTGREKESRLIRLHIFVVNSRALPAFLDRVRDIAVDIL